MFTCRLTLTSCLLELVLNKLSRKNLVTPGLVIFRQYLLAGFIFGSHPHHLLLNQSRDRDILCSGNLANSLNKFAGEKVLSSGVELVTLIKKDLLVRSR
jgi:hypothetical protein